MDKKLDLITAEVVERAMDSYDGDVTELLDLALPEGWDSDNIDYQLVANCVKDIIHDEVGIHDEVIDLIKKEVGISGQCVLNGMYGRDILFSLKVIGTPDQVNNVCSKIIDIDGYKHFSTLSCVYSSNNNNLPEIIMPMDTPELDNTLTGILSKSCTISEHIDKKSKPASRG